MPSDPLTDIVRSLKLTGGVFLEGEFTAPWAIESKVTAEDCQPFMLVPHQVIAYHVVTAGEMIVSLDGDEEYVAKVSDVVFLASNALHTLSSERGLPTAVGDDLVLPPAEGRLATIRFGGGGALTRILCGFIASDSGPCPLLDTLPEILIIAIEDIATLNWLEASIAMAARELAAGRVSSSAVMAQLSELLLVEALRAYLETEKHPKGWLAGMADPQIARTLAHIHHSISNPASIEDLTEEAGMSRSAFVQTFSEIIGMSPGRYALSQRMKIAESLLRETDLTTSQIAYRTGYSAPEAFSRAFKRETGISPAEWRSKKSQNTRD